MRRRRSGVVALTGLLAALAGGVGPIVLPAGLPAAAASADHRLAEMASPSRFRGLVYDGLSLGRTGSACTGAFEAKSRTGASLGCSHGPDPAPPGTDVRQGRSDGQVATDLRTGADEAPAAAPAAASVGSVGCIGDGTAGSRVQAIYAVPADRTDRSATVIPTIRSTYAPRVDWQFNTSAAETGGEAHVTFVTEPDAAGTGCRLAVAVAHLTAAGDDSFSSTVAELKAQGFNRPDRKYLVWTDAAVLCGVGSLYTDAKPGVTNLNNGFAPMYARVDAACWDYAEGHELMHTLGAVQSGAPHATAAGHCFDEPDEMCYDDDGNGPVTMLTVCAGRSDSLFDCNHDDYFYAGTPPLPSWLATHWNTYNSNWLLRGPLPSVATVPLPPGSSTGSTGSTGTGTTSSGTTGIIGTVTGTIGTILTGVPPLPGGPSPVVRHRVLDAHGRRPCPPVRRRRLLRPALPDDERRPGGRRRADPVRQRVLGPRRRGPRQRPSATPRPRQRLEQPARTPARRSASLSATPSGAGYWVFTTRGRAVPFGDAGFFGDMSALRLNGPVLGSVATPTGQGYYMVASDGGIFAFGDATFAGSMGGKRLNQPIVGMAPDPVRLGLLAGRLGRRRLRLRRRRLPRLDGRACRSTGRCRRWSATANGYLMVGEDGGVFTFSDRPLLRFSGRPPAGDPDRLRRPAELDRPAGADHAGVEAGQVEAAGQAGVLDLEAAVHDDVEAGVVGVLRPLPRPHRPSWSHSVFAPAAMASSATRGRSAGLRNTSTRSGGPGRSARLGYTGRPRISVGGRVHEPHARNRCTS